MQPLLPIHILAGVLWIAVSSFFLGQADVLPEAVRIQGLLALSVVTVVVVTLYWPWRVRARGNVRGIIGLSARETTP